MTDSEPTPTARTFTEWLRGFDTDRLAALLAVRPDLLHPPPDDIADLAARAATHSSVTRALHHLDAWLATVVEAVAALPDPVGVAEVTTLLGEDTDAADVATALAELARRGLVWGGPERHRLLRQARVAAGPYPGGLAPTADPPTEPARVTQALAELSDDGRAVLDRLVWGPPTGKVGLDRQQDPGSTVGRLIRVGLLRTLDDGLVLLPREVAWQLREPRRLLRDQPAPQAPEPTAEAVPDAVRRRVDMTAVGAAFELVADVEAVCEYASGAPLRLLRDGGLAVRDVGAAAAALQAGLPRTGLLFELAHATGLLQPTGQQTLLPTGAYDRWLGEPPVRRWEQLLHGWAAETRWYARGTRTGHHVLGPEGAWSPGPEVRRILLGELLARTETVGRFEVDPAAWTEVLGWHRPGWARASWPLLEAVEDVCTELHLLGVLSSQVTSALLPVLDRGVGVLPPAVLDQFPVPVEQVIIQGDLTAMSPGPLHHEVARDLRLLADQESRGAGATFRFSAATVRRAFDAGWSHHEITQWLTDHSSTGVPQPLAYLVADTARRHGSVRVGVAWCYVRTEDEAQTRSVLAHPDAAGLGLREIAPGVLVAAADAEEVIQVLRDLGLHPAAEDETGRTLTAPAPLRAGPARPATRPPEATPVDVARALVAAQERAASYAAATDDIVVTVHRAVADGAPLDLSYVRRDGTRAHAVATPIELGGGTVRLVGADGPWTVTLSRITGAAPHRP
ncbi:helicase-associated domain-containing protein [Propionibacteriaceae bacterium Y2011]